MSPEDFEHLNQYKWYTNCHGYIKGKVNKKDWLLHRYIKLGIMKVIIPNGYQIDHEDRIRSNNHRDNLRSCSPSENSRNKKKNENRLNKFIGVTKRKTNFEVSIRVNKRIYAFYDNEIHAAHQYNLWIDEYNLTTAIKNVIEIPKNFIKYESKKNLKKLPKGITYNSNKTRFKVNITVDKIVNCLGTFDALEEAREKI